MQNTQNEIFNPVLSSNEHLIAEQIFLSVHSAKELVIEINGTTIDYIKQK